MLYIAYFIIVSGHNIKKRFGKIFHFGGVEARKLFWQFVHTPNAIEPPTNSNFGGPMARVRWAQWPLRGTPWALKYPYCHQVITQTQPRGNRRFSEKVEM